MLLILAMLAAIRGLVMWPGIWHLQADEPVVVIVAVVIDFSPEDEELQQLWAARVLLDTFLLRRPRVQRPQRVRRDILHLPIRVPRRCRCQCR